MIYWGNIAAGVLQPALFLHFVLTFPEKREIVRKHPWLLALVYVPGAILLAAHVTAMHWLQASERLRWNMDRHGNVLRVAVLSGRGRCPLVQLPARQHHDSAAAVEVGDARHDSGDRSLHAVLCRSLPDGLAARRGHEGFGAVAGAAAADFRLRHLPLPPDGC